MSAFVVASSAVALIPKRKSAVHTWPPFTMLPQPATITGATATARARRTLRNLGERTLDLLRVPPRLHVAEDLRDAAVAPDDERRALHAEEFPARELLRLPHAVPVGDVVTFVHDQRERQVE